MKTFNAPSIDIYELDIEDIITTSYGDPDEETDPDRLPVDRD